MEKECRKDCLSSAGLAETEGTRLERAALRTTDEGDSMIQFVKEFNMVVVLILSIAYFYQMGYLAVGLVGKLRRHRQTPRKLHRYAAIVSARNEESVIAELIASLKNQNYPAELLDIYVVADNCTDSTAEVSRRAGAIVYERFDSIHKGKGYAMDYLFHCLAEAGRDDYDGYFVFDADNIVDPNFVREMNVTFDTGKYGAITSYRNSKNFGDNWISAGYSLWFLREARFLNSPRMLLGTGCAVSGTGFLIAAQVIRDNGGWPFHLLTEDIEFSVDCALKGIKIGYCDKAMIYDEQPTTFRQSWDQRLRWSKGFYQVDMKYGLSLVKGCARLSRRGWTCYDLLMTVAPGMLLTILTLAFNAILCVACIAQPIYIARRVVALTLGFLWDTAVGFYLGLLVYGVITLILEWKKIRATPLRKIVYLFSFPLFMSTYVPISIAALVRKVEWKPIYHNASGVYSMKSAG